jgi:hypothetical protein
MGKFLKKNRDGGRSYRAPAVLLISIGLLLSVAAISLGQNGPQTSNSQFAVDSSGTGAPPTEPPPTPPKDTTPPALTSIGGAQKIAPKKRAKFTFASNEAGTFVCQIDKRGFQPCTSPFTAPRLKAGHHTFLIQAIDSAGNGSSVTSYGFFVKKQPKPLHRKHRRHHR